MEPYTHRVAYYETDKMGISHHSNYIRWMEEARVDFLSRIGWGFRALEESGIASPVLAVSCQYKHSTTFDDAVDISVRVRSFEGLRLTIAYEMRLHGTGETVCTGTTEHCFLNAGTGRPVRLQRDYPAFYEALMAHREAPGAR